MVLSFDSLGRTEHRPENLARRREPASPALAPHVGRERPLRDAMFIECEMRTESGLVNTADFDDERHGTTAAQVLVELKADPPSEEELVVTHGDYCMPNVLFGEDLTLTGFIDLGRAGVADWHSDVALATRSIERNLGKSFVEPFYKRYGKQPDVDRLGYYLMLDEFF